MIDGSGDAWTLMLAGSSIARVEETVKMVVALFANNIPFILHGGEAIISNAYWYPLKPILIT
jgi:hypothetical protein